jgi:dipeptidyl aminopeptidase/acylaminoacyl peptidase
MINLKFYFSLFSSKNSQAILSYLIIFTLMSSTISAQDSSFTEPVLPSVIDLSSQKKTDKPLQEKPLKKLTASPSPLVSSLIDSGIIQTSFTLSAPPSATFDISGRIAFTAKVKDTEGIFVLDLDSNTFSPLILGPGNNRYPTISPDGKYIAFVSDRDGNSEIYVTRWDGTSVTRITKNSTEDTDPTWLPRTSAILFSRIAGKEPNITTELRIASLVDNNQQLTSNEVLLCNLKGRNVNAAWTPIKDMVTYSSNRFWPGWDICGWQIASKSERCFFGGDESFGRAKWSPDGLQLVFSHGDGRNMNLGLSLLGKKSFSDITTSAGNEYDPEWSPNGEYLIFVADGATQIYQPYILKLEDRSYKQLFKSLFSIRYLSWSPHKTTDLEIDRISQMENSKVTEENDLN